MNRTKPSNYTPIESKFPPKTRDNFRKGRRERRFGGNGAAGVFCSVKGFRRQRREKNRIFQREEAEEFLSVDARVHLINDPNDRIAARFGGADIADALRRSKQPRGKGINDADNLVHIREEFRKDFTACGRCNIAKQRIAGHSVRQA